MNKQIVRRAEEMILEFVQDGVDFPVELFFHDDHRELAIINSDTREFVFSSDTIVWVSFARAFGYWCDKHGIIPGYAGKKG